MFLQNNNCKIKANSIINKKTFILKNSYIALVIGRLISSNVAHEQNLVCQLSSGVSINICCLKFCTYARSYNDSEQRFFAGELKFSIG